ncbi:uncharacterized protein LOC134254717 [Saccostrea cucullata]|uniref:uncharacterized protein LOC134254717 n=1 Tax=Saccostrea cuccullata TaxID=36930 RepID=UPI002ED0F229
MATKLGRKLFVILFVFCKQCIFKQITDYHYECTGCTSLKGSSVCQNCTNVEIRAENISDILPFTGEKKGDSLSVIIVSSVIGGILCGSLITTFGFLCIRMREKRGQKRKNRVLHHLQNPSYEHEDRTQNDLDQEKKNLALYSEINDDMLNLQTGSNAIGNKEQQNISEHLPTADETHAYNHLYETDELRRGHLQTDVAKANPSLSGLTDEEDVMPFKATDIRNSLEKVDTLEKGYDAEKQNKSTGQYYVLEKATQFST